MGPPPHPPNPSPELLLSCPRCRRRVIALTLADEPDESILWWTGRCSLCRAKILVTAGRDEDRDRCVTPPDGGEGEG